MHPLQTLLSTATTPRPQKNFKILTQRKFEIHAEARDLLAGSPSPEQLARADVLLTEIEGINSELAQWAKIHDRERAEVHGERRGVGHGRGRTFAEMFPSEPLSNGGFESFGEYLSVVHSGLHHPALMAAGSVGVPSQGGFAVPTEYAAVLLDRSLEDEIVRPRAMVEPMLYDTKKVPAWDGHNHTGGSLYGGFRATWLAELGESSEKDFKLRLMELKAWKLALFTRVSNELIADGSSMSFEGRLGDAMIKATGWNLDDAFLNGDGAAKPLGVVNDPALITVAKETGQLAGTILYDNVVKMFARLHPACVGNSIWVANSNTIPQLLTLTMPVGTGGSHIPVLQESNGGYRLLTREIIFTEKLPALGQKGDLILADFSQYYVGLRKEMALEKSMHVGWSTDSSGYRVILRADGQGSWGTPVTPKNGDTLSWAVAIETRS